MYLHIYIYEIEIKYHDTVKRWTFVSVNKLHQCRHSWSRNVSLSSCLKIKTRMISASIKGKPLPNSRLLLQS